MPGTMQNAEDSKCTINTFPFVMSSQIKLDGKEGT